jgi:two-component system, NtrC family, sensor kinase
VIPGASMAGMKVDPSLNSAKLGELKEKYVVLSDRARKLEELVEIISRGKYMWESTFDAITAPVQIVTADYEILRANLSLAAVGDEDIASLIGCKCYVALAGRDEPCFGCPLKSALADDVRITSNLSTPVCGRDFEVSAYPLSHISDKRSAVLYYRDITEERRLQREVIQQEKMAAIGILAGGVAHEINNPIGGIIAFVQLMKRDAKENETLLDDLLEIEKAALRCKKIVADLLDFSRVSRDRERRLVDVNLLLEKVFPFIEREMRSMNVELIFREGKNIPMIRGIPDRLQQIFINLMTNACHAMTKGGTITVTTKLEGEYVVIRVRDDGPGISDDVRDRIFDPFYTTKEPGKGTGLGLSISYRIVKDHGGEIICSDVTDSGAEFIVRFPRARDEGEFLSPE